MPVEFTGLVGGMAKCASADRGFPRERNLEAVRKRISLGQADGDTLETLEEVQLDYASY